MTDEAIYERLAADFETAVTISMAGAPDTDPEPLYETRLCEHGMDATELVLTFPDGPPEYNAVKVRPSTGSVDTSMLPIGCVDA